MTRKRRPSSAPPPNGTAPTAHGFGPDAKPRLAEANPERPRKSALGREAARLRREAEHRLRNSPVAHSKPHPPDPPTTVEDPRRLLHELQVHQIELEMQQGSLQEARDGLEALLAKYTHLYDFAPVGYFTLDPTGRLLEVNLTGAKLLGVERSALIGRPLQQYLLPESQPGFVGFLAQVFATRRQHSCAVTLRKANGKPLPAHLHGTQNSPSSLPHACRVTLSDIASLRRAADSRSRLQAMAASNRRLKREITRRLAVETALRANKEQQQAMLRKSQRGQEELRDLSRGILQAQEEERKRISRDLHDEISQTLVGIHVHLENLFRDTSLRPSFMRKSIQRTQRLVEKSVRIVHRFARELRPAALDDLGLVPTLRSYVQEFTARTGIPVRFTQFSNVEVLNVARRTTLYRVAQSALSNVARHSQATEASLSLQVVSDVIQLEVSDNGRGFDAQGVLLDRRNPRLGLIGMRERVEMVGGTFSMESNPGGGTTVRAYIPASVLKRPPTRP